MASAFEQKVNPYDLPISPITKELDPKPLPSSVAQEVILKNYIVSIIKKLAPKYGVTEEKLLEDIYEVTPSKARTQVETVPELLLLVH